MSAPAIDRRWGWLAAVLFIGTIVWVDGRLYRNRLAQPTLSFHQHVNANLTTLRGAKVGSDDAVRMPTRDQYRNVLAQLPLVEAVHQGARYLQKSVDQDGRFTYLQHLQHDRSSTKKYNVLRHAGGIYSLADYCLRYDNSDVLAAAVRACDYLQRTSISPLPNDNNMLAVWSRSSVNGSNSVEQAKLGGTGLTLVAFASLRKLVPTVTSDEEMARLAEFLCLMQKADGSFYSKYIPSQGGRDDRWTSLYYPGEAALGLLMLFDQDPKEKWFAAAYRALRYLAESRAGETQLPADHWALLATARILSIDDQGKCPQQIDRSLIVNHAEQVCRAILVERLPTNDRLLRGAFTPDGRTTPVATRLEGLLALRPFLTKESSLQQDVDEAIVAGVTLLVASQVNEGPFAGAIPRSVGMIQPESKASANFNRRALEVRIDYVQHAMSALMQVSRSLETADSTAH